MHQAATAIFSRLSEIEKINLRGAQAEDRLKHLALTMFQSDLPLATTEEKILIATEVKALCDLQFATNGSTTGFGQTWLF
jgi:hypothetical protein